LLFFAEEVRAFGRAAGRGFGDVEVREADDARTPPRVGVRRVAAEAPLCVFLGAMSP
jgi:hypothetical protein